MNPDLEILEIKRGVEGQDIVYGVEKLLSDIR